MKKVMVGLVLIGMVFASGCCSMMSYSGAKQDYVQRVNAQRAASGNVGLNLLDPGLWDVMAEHPIRTTVCALADAAMAAGVTYAITASYSNSKADKNIEINGNNNSVNANYGNNNSNSGTTTPGNNNQVPGGLINEGASSNVQ